MTEPARFGQRTGEAAASFRCAACGEIAALVKAVPAEVPADIGPPLGSQSHRRDGIVVDYFGGTARKLADPGTCAAVRAILDSDEPDPAELRRIGWELAPFCCPECERTYCRAHWHTYVLFDEGSTTAPWAPVPPGTGTWSTTDRRGSW